MILLKLFVWLWKRDGEHGYIQIGPSVCTSIKEIAGDQSEKIRQEILEIVYEYYDQAVEGRQGTQRADYTKAKQY